jgi:hypothetical protein
MRICARARQEWGTESVISSRSGATTRVQIWLDGSARSHHAGNPVGLFVIRWGHPAPQTATIERIAWDPGQGGSADEVRQVIDALAGWPVATSSASMRR